MSVLPPNTSTAQAKLIQRALNEKTGASLTVDGQFGPKSVAALATFQQKNNLPLTGVYDAATQALVAPFIAQKYLNATEIAQAAHALGVDVPAVQTVCQVETNGAGFFNNGQCAILFERVQFYKAMAAVTPAAQLAQLVQQYPNIINPQTGGYMGGVAEWGRLQQAQQLNNDLALRSASWGLFQIMGYNYVSCGYSSVEAFVTDMMNDEGKQLKAFVTFLQDDMHGRRQLALQQHDWLNFALLYNGPNEAQTNPPYHARLATAYVQLTA
jgi:peptidoglycan hydrolase-like protein with peptidoglycan-binding domain